MKDSLITISFILKETTTFKPFNTTACEGCVLLFSATRSYPIEELTAIEAIFRIRKYCAARGLNQSERIYGTKCTISCRTQHFSRGTHPIMKLEEFLLMPYIGWGIDKSMSLAFLWKIFQKKKSENCLRVLFIHKKEKFFVLIDWLKIDVCHFKTKI
jgi:hypothetical protein